MKNYLVFAFGTLLLFSCSKEVLPDQVEPSAQEENRTEKEPTAVTAKAKATITGQYGIYQDPKYPWAFVQNNIWSIDAGDFGADPGQYLWYNNIGSWGVKAYTTQGKESYSGVKSYPGLVYGRHYNNVSENRNGFPVKVSSIKGNLDAEWSVRVENDGGPNAIYNASYDIWFDPDKNQKSTNKYEIMIWTLRKNQNPINDGEFGVPWKSNVKVFNARYDVYKGTIFDGKQQVLTFILRDGKGYFKAPLKAFIDSAVNWGWMGSNNYMTSIQAGFEICTAGTKQNRANFVTNKFYLKAR